MRSSRRLRLQPPLVASATARGRLRAGYDADIAVFDGNVLSDVTALRAVEHVFVRGAAVS